METNSYFPTAQRKYQINVPDHKPTTALLSVQPRASRESSKDPGRIIAALANVTAATGVWLSASPPDPFMIGEWFVQRSESLWCKVGWLSFRTLRLPLKREDKLPQKAADCVLIKCFIWNCCLTTPKLEHEARGSTGKHGLRRQTFRSLLIQQKYTPD